MDSLVFSSTISFMVAMCLLDLLMETVDFTADQIFK